MNPFADPHFWLSWNGVAFALGCIFLLFALYAGIRWTMEDRKRDREALRKSAEDQAGSYEEYRHIRDRR